MEDELLYPEIVTAASVEIVVSDGPKQETLQTKFEELEIVLQIVSKLLPLHCKRGLFGKEH